MAWCKRSKSYFIRAWNPNSFLPRPHRRSWPRSRVGSCSSLLHLPLGRFPMTFRFVGRQTIFPLYLHMRDRLDIDAS